jgi:DNA-binding transcriptional LysR family regulator
VRALSEGARRGHRENRTVGREVVVAADVSSIILAPQWSPIPPRMSLLATGRFVTILPASALKFPAMRAEIKALPVHLPRARVPNGIVTLKTRALSPVAQIFIDCAREVAKTPEKRS